MRSVVYNASSHSVAVTLAKPYKGEIRISLTGLIEAANGTSSSAAFSAVVR